MYVKDMFNILLGSIEWRFYRVMEIRAGMITSPDFIAHLSAQLYRGPLASPFDGVLWLNGFELFQLLPNRSF